MDHAGLIRVGREDPRSPEAAALVGALDAYLGGLYPPQSNRLLDVARLAADDVRFLVARREGAAVGCVALRLDPAGWGEVKRLYVRPEARGGVGRALMDRLEAEARAAGLSALRLETGVRQPEAIGLLKAVGFRERGRFDPYSDDPLSLFMEKAL